MPAGRPRKPSHLLADPRDRRISEQMDKALEAKAPECPSTLDNDEKKVWKEIVKRLDDANVLRETDSNALERYCVTFVAWRKITAHLKKEGYTYIKLSREGNKSVVERPEVAMQSKWANELTKLESSFGLTPADRTRIKIGDPKKGTPDDKADFFNLVG